MSSLNLAHCFPMLYWYRMRNDYKGLIGLIWASHANLMPMLSACRKVKKTLLIELNASDVAEILEICRRATEAFTSRYFKNFKSGLSVVALFQRLIGAFILHMFIHSILFRFFPQRPERERDFLYTFPNPFLGRCTTRYP